jgi:hypothetical protein
MVNALIGLAQVQDAAWHRERPTGSLDAPTDDACEAGLGPVFPNVAVS